MKKDTNILIRLTKSEKLLINYEAQKLNISTSELIRRILTNGVKP